MSIGKKIKEARLDLNISQAELAQRCGWESESGRVRVNNYEAEKREPRTKDVALLAKALKKPKEWFYSDSLILEDKITDGIPCISFVELANIEAINYESLSYLTIHMDGLFAIKVEGDSMLSSQGVSFPDKAMILVSIDFKPLSGNFVVAKLEDGNVIFRQLILEGSERYLRALNPAWKPVNLTDRTKIIGVVVSSIMQFR